jgi:pectate lyase
MRVSLFLTGLAAMMLAAPSFAQLPAFPGAEGAGMLASGGRGGDVYKVINLNDSGPGSLRYGIQNAPTTGRTIVFDVSGTINLASSLNFDGKDNITIAGQTAPGGGITLSGHQLRVNSQKNGSTVLNQLDNVIVQHLRVRPTNLNANTDGVWVETATKVMIDHITTSWSVDENISVTHDSNNVTVQWSTMSQGLFSHSYGSLINGGNYTYHHNLYTQNKSRNPRIQDSGNRYLNLDFVNNVIYNPQDQFGYSDGDDPYDANLVANYGIKGPQSNDVTDHLMRPEDAASRFYVEGNVMDIVRDGILNGTPVEGNNVFRPGGEWTLSPTRYGTNLPEIAPHTAQQAYVHVLSRAGAFNFRDAHDRDMIYQIMNQEVGHLATHTEWGAMPTLPPGTALPDSNADGVPDTWALTNGFDPSTALHQTYAPDGYTYLEKYIHSLTPYAYAPTNLVEHTIRTGFGAGADVQIDENGGTSATSAGWGAKDSIDVQWAGTAGNTNQAMLLKFDLSEIVPGSVDNARLELTTAAPVVGTHDFKVYGLIHDAVGWDWYEQTTEFSNAPGLSFDGNSRTLGIDPRYTANGNLATRSNLPLAAPEDVLTLGTFSLGNTAAGETVSFENLNLAVLLNLAAFFEGEQQAGLVTLIIQQTNNSSAASFVSKEGNELLAPRLVVNATLLNPPIIEDADFDGDGDVDGRDFLIWQRGFGLTGQENKSFGDANGDGDVNANDLAIWQTQYAQPGELTASQTAVPEPTCLIILSTLGILALSRRNRAA